MGRGLRKPQIASESCGLAHFEPSPVSGIIFAIHFEALLPLTTEAAKERLRLLIEAFESCVEVLVLRNRAWLFAAGISVQVRYAATKRLVHPEAPNELQERRRWKP